MAKRQRISPNEAYCDGAVKTAHGEFSLPCPAMCGIGRAFPCRIRLNRRGSSGVARKEPYMNPLLLQWVLQSLGRCKIRRVVHARGIRAAPLGKRKVFDPPSMEQTGKALIAFDAARLGVESILCVTLPGEFLLDGPGLGPHGWIFDCDFV